MMCTVVIIITPYVITYQVMLCTLFHYDIHSDNEMMCIVCNDALLNVCNDALFNTVYILSLNDVHRYIMMHYYLYVTMHYFILCTSFHYKVRSTLWCIPDTKETYKNMALLQKRPENALFHTVHMISLFDAFRIPFHHLMHIISL